MKEDVSFVDEYVEHRNLFTTIHDLPHSIHSLVLRRVAFETLDCLNTFIHGLHNRKIENLVIDGCVFTTPQLARLLLMMEDLGVTSLALTNMDIQSPICESISVFGNRLSNLDLSGNNICSKGLEYILSMKGLVGLDMSHNPCLQNFCEWSVLVSTFKWLRLRGCFEEGAFSRFCDELDGVSWKSELLDLSDNKLDVYSLARFVHISRSSHIESLYVCDNFIDDRIADPLIRCSHVKNVYLDRNKHITTMGIEKLLLRPRGHVSFRGCVVDEARLSQVETVNRVHRGDIGLLNKLSINMGLERRLREFL